MYDSLYRNLSLWRATPNLSSIGNLYKKEFYEEGNKLKFIDFYRF